MTACRRAAALVLASTFGLSGTAVHAIPPPGFLGVIVHFENGAPAAGVHVRAVSLSESWGTVEGVTNTAGQLWLSLAPGTYRVFVRGNLDPPPVEEIVSNGEVILWITVATPES